MSETNHRAESAARLESTARILADLEDRAHVLGVRAGLRKGPKSPPVTARKARRHRTQASRRTNRA